MDTRKADWVHDFLTSQDGRLVQTCLLTAFEVAPRCDFMNSKYVRDMIHSVSASEDLHVKKFMWVAILMGNDAMQRHCLQNGGPGTRRWISRIPGCFDDFACGGYSSENEPLIGFLDDILRIYQAEANNALADDAPQAYPGS